MSGRVLEGRNRATADEAASFVDKFDELEKKIDALKIEHMNKVRAVRQEQSEVLDDAKSQGVPKKVVKAIAESRKLEAKAKAKIDDLEPDEKSYAIDIRKALGGFADLPLGAAAVERADQQDPTTAAIVDAASKEWDDAAPPSKH